MKLPFEGPFKNKYAGRTPKRISCLYSIRLVFFFTVAGSMKIPMKKRKITDASGVLEKEKLGRMATSKPNIWMTLRERDGVRLQPEKAKTDSEKRTDVDKEKDGQGPTSSQS